MNSVIEQYRKTPQGQADRRDSWTLILQFGDKARKDGTFAKLAKEHPDFAKDYEDLRAEGAASTFTGIKNVAKNAWDSSMQALGTIGGIGEDSAVDIAERQQRISERPTSLAWQDWQTAEGDDAVKVFLKDPIEITSNIVASGLGGSVPTLALGAAGGAAGPLGAAIGAGTGSLATEYGSKYLEVLREAGADLSDPQSILKFTSDKALTDKAVELGLRRGLPVAAFDAISAGIAGKLFKGAKGASTAKKVGVGSAEVGIQGGLGGAGEVAGSLSAGDPINTKAVFEEVVGEIGPGAVEVGLGTMRGRQPVAPTATTPLAPPVRPPAPPVAAPAAAPVAPPRDIARVVASRTPEANAQALASLQAIPAPTPEQANEIQLITALLGLSQSPAAVAAAAKTTQTTDEKENLQAQAQKEVVPPTAPPAAVVPPVPAAAVPVVPPVAPVVTAPVVPPAPIPPAVDVAQPPVLNNVPPATTAPSAGGPPLPPVPAAAPRPKLPAIKVNTTPSTTNARDYKGSGLVGTMDQLKAALPSSNAKADPAMVAFETEDGRVVVSEVKYSNKPITALDGSTKRGHRITGMLTPARTFDPATGTKSMHIDDMPGKPLAIIRSETPTKLVYANRAEFDEAMKEAGVVDNYQSRKEAAKAETSEEDKRALNGDPDFIIALRSPWVADGKVDLAQVPADPMKIVTSTKVRSDGKLASKKSREHARVALRTAIAQEMVKHTIGSDQHSQLNAKLEAVAAAIDIDESSLAPSAPVKGRAEPEPEPIADAPSQWMAAANDVQRAQVYEITKSLVAKRSASAAEAKSETARDRVLARPLSSFIDARDPAIKGVAQSLRVQPSELIEHAERTYDASDPSKPAEFAERFELDDPTAEFARREAVLEESRRSSAFARVFNQLRRMGVRVDLIAKNFIDESKTVGVTYSGYHIAVALGDVRSPTMSNLVTLLHEAGHATLKMRRLQVKRMMSRAAEGLAKRARLASEKTGVQVNTNLDQNYEEALVEAVAQELTAEGMEDGMGPAQQIVSWVKELYQTMVMAINRALGRQVHPEFFEAWFKNHLAGMLGGRFDYVLADLFRPRSKRAMSTINGLGTLEKWMNPFTGQMETPMVLPTNRDAITYGDQVQQGFSVPPSGTVGELFESLPWTERERDLIKAISRFVKDVPYKVVDGLNQVAGYNGKSGVVLGRKIEGRSPRFVKEAILHESAHAATMAALERNQEAVERLERLRTAAMVAWHRTPNSALKTAKDSDGQFRSAFESVQEFVAYALTSKRFQEFLGSVKPSSANKFSGKAGRFEGTLLGDFWETLTRLLGVKDSSVLSETLTITESLFSYEQLSGVYSLDISNKPASMYPLTIQPRAIQPAVNRREAANWNPNADIDLQTSNAYLNAAALNLYNDALESARDGMDLAKFWAIVGEKDHPRELLDAQETAVRGSSDVKVTDERLTPPIKQRAWQSATSMIRKLQRKTHEKAAQLDEDATQAASELMEQAELANELEGKYRDMSMHEARFQDTLKELVKDLAAKQRTAAGHSFKAGRLAEAIAEADQRLEDDPIPENYQTVFKAILDGKVAVGDYMAAMAKTGLSFGLKTSAEIREAILIASQGDATLAALVKNRPLFIALTELARKQYRQMDLLALSRNLKTDEFLKIHAELEAIRTATPEVLKKLEQTVRESLRSASLAERLRAQYVDARRILRRSQSVIQRAEANVAILRRTSEIMEEAASKIEPELGAFSNWVPSEGETWFSMIRKGTGWNREERKIKFGSGGIIEDPELLGRLAENTAWLKENVDKQGQAMWNAIERQTKLLKYGDFVQARHATTRFIADRVTQSLQQRFASLGKAASTSISRMFFKYQTILEGEFDGLEAKSVKWQAAATAAVKAFGYKGNAAEFYDEVLTPVIYAVESEPGMGETASLRVAFKKAKAQIIDQTKIAPDAKDRLADLLRQHKVLSESLTAIAEKNGVYIQDDTLKDPLGLNKEGLMRHAIAYGWLTSTRSIKADAIRLLTDRMQAAGWNYAVSTKKEEGTGKSVSELVKDSAVMGEFTPEVVQDFLEPFIYKPGAPVFKTPQKDKIPQIEIQTAWEASGKNVEQFLAILDETFPPTDVEGEPIELDGSHWLNQINQLYTRMAGIAVDSMNVGTVLDANYSVQPHRLMDARKDDIIPPEFLEYDTFDRTSTRVALGQVAFAAAFGRNGRNMVSALSELESQMSGDVAAWNAYHGSKKRIEAAGYNWHTVKAAHDNATAIRSWGDQWVTAMGAGQTSQLGDLRVGLDTLRFVTGMLLNQPTSGFWNWMSLLEFPTAYKAIGGASMRATARAMAEATRSLAGRLTETIGLDILRKAEHRDAIDAIQARSAMKASYVDLMRDAGMRGKLEEGKVNTYQRIIRGAGLIMRKANFLAPFRVLNDAAGEGVIRGQLGVFETMVGKGIEFFERRPDAFNDPSFRFRMEDVGMKGTGVFGDEGAFLYFRQQATDYGLGALEDIAREAMQRKTKGEPLLTRDQAVSIGTMALNDVALEASVNTRPEWTRLPAIQWAMPLLGWPIAKVGMVNASFKGTDGVGFDITNPTKEGLRNLARGMTILLGWSLPAGLAASLAMDEWDEEVKGKKANRRAVDGIAAVPLVGPALALVAGERDPWDNFLGMTERAIRAGTYGIGTELIAQFYAPLDPTSGQKAFSLDNRVFLVSAIRSIQGAVTSWVNGEAATYANVGRPLLQAIGGNGPLEGVQIMSNLFNLDTEERRMAIRTSMRNWLTAAGKEAGLEVRPRIAMAVAPTPTSVWIREMEIAALANDRLRFGEAYRNAVEAARRSSNSETRPEQAVLNSWRGKHPMTVFRNRDLTPDQTRRLYLALGEEGRAIVKDSLALYDRYTALIEPSPMQQQMRRMESSFTRTQNQLSPESLRRQAASW